MIIEYVEYQFSGEEIENMKDSDFSFWTNDLPVYG